MCFYTIDIGNTQIKIAKFENNNLVEINYFDKILDFYDFYSNQNVVKSILSSVRNFKWDESVLPIPLLLNNELRLPFENKYASKETLGNDRKALVTAAIQNFQNQNCLIIDAGTCITYDFVDASKNYYGGAISLGLNMRYKSLHHYTAKLPELKFPNVEINILGNSTENCINSGVFFGILHEMEGFINDYQKKTENLTILLTGGDAKYFEKHLNTPIFVVPNLQMEGLYHILKQND